MDSSPDHVGPRAPLMLSATDMVAEFHRRAGDAVRRYPESGITVHERLTRARLVLEEALEFVEACGFRITLDTGSGQPVIDPRPFLEFDIIKAAHELADLNYVTEGSAHVFGVPLLNVLIEVHRANMSRFLPNGKIHRHPMRSPRPDSSYRPPDILRVLRDAGWEPDEY